MVLKITVSVRVAPAHNVSRQTVITAAFPFAAMDTTRIHQWMYTSSVAITDTGPISGGRIVPINYARLSTRLSGTWTDFHWIFVGDELNSNISMYRIYNIIICKFVCEVLLKYTWRFHQLFVAAIFLTHTTLHLHRLIMYFMTSNIGLAGRIFSKNAISDPQWEPRSNYINKMKYSAFQISILID